MTELRLVHRRRCGTRVQHGDTNVVAGRWRVSFPSCNNQCSSRGRQLLKFICICRSNVANTARCWARETVIAMGDDLVTSSLPRGAASSPCYEYFGPSYNLDIMPALMKDLNTPGYLQSLKEKVCAELDANAAVADPAPGAIASLQGGEDEAGAAGNSRKRSAAAAGLPPSGV
jgi:hypothetical protein